MIRHNHKNSRLMRVLVAGSALGWVAYAATPAEVTDAVPGQAQREADDLTDPLRAEAAPFPGKLSEWFGFARYDFEVGGHAALVVAPKQAAPGRPWVWHGEFFGHKPNPDLALLGRGFHVVYLSVPDLLGCPEAVRHWDTLYRVLTERYGFAAKPALVGLSRGGLYCYNWAIAHPDQTACVYGDAPVCDFKSWQMRVVRSRELVHWQPSSRNPVLRASPEDKVVVNPRLDERQRARVAEAVNLNNSDINFCEWQGRLVIDYSWGNQQGVEHLAEAVYDGTLESFLRGWFPER